MCIRDRGIKVPPPTHMPATWPKAVRVAVPLPIAAPNNLAIDPAKDMPENPEPSNPVIAPTVAVSYTHLLVLHLHIILV